MGIFSAFIQDMDGDESWWVVRQNEAEIVSGYAETFNLAVQAVEAVLIAHGRLYVVPSAKP